MRIVFINLQHNNFLLNNYYQLMEDYKIKSYKHKFLIDYFISQNVQILNYIISNSLDEYVEESKKAEFVFAQNGFSNGSITNISNLNLIDTNDVCIVYFHNFREYIASKQIKCKKLLMSNHFIRVKKGQRFNLKEDGFSAFISETDLSSNPFVNKFFNLDGIKTIVCPYTFESRFRLKKSFKERSNKLLAIGSLSTVKGIAEYSGYVEYYGTEWVQPFGVEIMKKEWMSRSWLDSRVSSINQGFWKPDKNDNALIKYIKNAYNSKHERQGKYLSFDMVQEYNNHKMFLRPEELVGNSSIGMVEGMACGAVYMGVNENIYFPLGMKAGEHYIRFDGTFRDLKKQYRFYINKPEELEKISENGMRLVREMFEPNVVAKGFLLELKALCEA